MRRRLANVLNTYATVVAFGLISGLALGLWEVFCAPGIEFSFFLIGRTYYYSTQARLFIILFDACIGIFAASAAAIVLAPGSWRRRRESRGGPHRQWLSTLTLLFLALLYGLMAVNSNAVLMGIEGKTQVALFCGYALCILVFAAAYLLLARTVSDTTFIAAHTLASLYLFFVLVQGQALRWYLRGETLSGIAFGPNAAPLLVYAVLFAALAIGLAVVVVKAPSLTRVLAFIVPYRESWRRYSARGSRLTVLPASKPFAADWRIRPRTTRRTCQTSFS